jgi:hypothetical protein
MLINISVKFYLAIQLFHHGKCGEITAAKGDIQTIKGKTYTHYSVKVITG